MAPKVANTHADPAFDGKIMNRLARLVDGLADVLVGL